MKITTECTEQQAMQRICWLSLDKPVPPHPGNPAVLQQPQWMWMQPQLCRGSMCMAWRWSMIDPTGKRGDDRGYCGLVPQPGETNE